MNKMDVYLDMLAELGFRPERTSTGNAVFKYEGRTHYLYANETDPDYFQLVCPNFWSIDSVEELQRALYCASEISRDTKVAKAYINDDETRVSIAVEMFVDDLDHLRPIFTRTLNALSWAVSEFRQRMRARVERVRQEERMTLIRRWLRESIGQGSLAMAGDLFAPDYVERGSLATLTQVRGPEAAQAIVGAVRVAFANPRILVAAQIVEHDQIVTRWTVTGVHHAPFMDLPPSGQSVICNAVQIYRFRDDQITESWTMMDRPVIITPTPEERGS